MGTLLNNGAYAKILCRSFVPCQSGFGKEQSVVVDHWRTGARVLLLEATRGRSGCPRCFFSREKLTHPVKFMLAEGA